MNFSIEKNHSKNLTFVLVFGKLRPLGSPNQIADDSISDSDKFGQLLDNDSNFKVKIVLNCTISISF